MMKKFFQFKGLLQKQGWLTPAFVGIDANGVVNYLSQDPPSEPIAVEAVQGYALPGFQNAHSHAFQFAMAGLAEIHTGNQPDDFWTWREVMYQCALSLDPEEAEAVAAMLYTEMLRHGYTHVTEFHYLHHDKNGTPYQNLAEMGERMVSAAKTAGINITLIPVFYQKGGFNTDPQPRQRRFISKTADQYFHLLDDSANVVKDHVHARLGFSVHSLRAVNPQEIVKTFNNGPSNIPFHLHVSEQRREVEDCIAHLDKRPVEWLFENLPVNNRFHLVHATHLNDYELQLLATSEASVVLCPSTEGNLGDGIFRMKEYAKAGGNWSIGTDSHIGLNPLEECRMIDYRQRLVTTMRNTFEGDSASYLVKNQIENGRRAMGLNYSEYFSAGQPFEAVVFDADAPLLQVGQKNLLSTIIYTSDISTILGTIVNGRWVVTRQHHQNAATVRKAFLKAIKSLRF